MSIQYRRWGGVSSHAPDPVCPKSGLQGHDRGHVGPCCTRRAPIWAMTSDSSPSCPPPQSSALVRRSMTTVSVLASRNSASRSSRFHTFGAVARRGAMSGVQPTASPARRPPSWAPDAVSADVLSRPCASVQADIIGPDCFSTGIPPFSYPAVGAAAYARRHSHVRRAPWRGSSSPTTPTVFGSYS